jgi:flagellar hook protein FlgE
MEVSSQSDSIIADLRRAAIPGALGSAVDRNADVLVDSGALSGVGRFIPNPAPLAVAIDGPGLFIFQEGTERVYGRLGDFRLDGAGRLVDGAGRAVMGFRIEHGVQRDELEPIALPTGSPRDAAYQIDAHGVLCSVVRSPQTMLRHARAATTPIARVALALFPAPQRLERADSNTLVAARAAGVAALNSPGDHGAGTLRAHVVAAGAVDIEADLRSLWLLRRKAELSVALAAASDECTRTALGLVR